MLSQPDWKVEKNLAALGKPRLGVLVSGETLIPCYAIILLPANYAKKIIIRRVELWENVPTMQLLFILLAKKIWPDLPVIIGGIEASLRRFAHYDYLENKLLPSILIESSADLLIYGMGEKASR